LNDTVGDLINGLFNGTNVTGWINNLLNGTIGDLINDLLNGTNITDLINDVVDIIKNLIGLTSPSQFTNITVSGTGVVTVVLTDSTGKAIPNANVSYTIDGVQTNATTDAFGRLSVDAANKIVAINYAGDKSYLPTNIDLNLVNFAPKRKETTIVGKDFNQVAMDFYAGERGGYFVVQLKDVAGNILANKTVKIGFNGVVYTVTTNATGHAKLQINLAGAGLYTFAVAFLGDDEYDASFTVYKITITKKSTSITASAKTFKSSAKTKSYTVTLKASKNPINGKTYLKAGKKLTLKLNGKTYTAKVNSNGKATFKLKITKKGKFVSTIKFAGDSTYTASSKSVRISIK
jgi:hypothetical protein